MPHGVWPNTSLFGTRCGWRRGVLVGMEWTESIVDCKRDCALVSTVDWFGLMHSGFQGGLIVQGGFA
eukprot:508414-Lingulodinium_polyedra.AAC.1